MRKGTRNLIMIAASLIVLALVLALTSSAPVIADSMKPLLVRIVGSTAVVEYRFVGVSSNSVATDAGLVALHNTCQAEFGPSARVCTTVEFVRSPEIGGLSIQTGGLLLPVVAGEYGFFDSSDGSRVFGIVDATGIQIGLSTQLNGLTPDSLNCRNWTDSTGNSRAPFLVPGQVSPTLTHLNCGANSPSRVVCCAPRQ